MERGNLIISRRLNESFKIGDNITVTVHRIKGGEVRLAIAAPKNIKVLRDNAKEKT